MKMIRSITMLALLVAWPAPAAAEAAPADEAKTGLAVGEKAPEFTLKDQNGEERSLAGLLEAGPVALVFSRSAEW
jgi:cytochrome oxidase Cu insertion factor (SCO1/SenC/PrrC family)